MAEVQSICTVDGCAKPGAQRRMCWMHYERNRKYGSTDPHTQECATCGAVIHRGAKRGPLPRFCSLECKQQSYRKPGTADGKCAGCGGVIDKPHTTRNVKYCHPNCRHLARRNRNRKREAACTQCGEKLTYTGREPDGTLSRGANKRRCDQCSSRVRPHRYGMTARQIADRDGATCRWCNTEVDFSLVGTRTKWAPSVDHIIPWARGGTNDPKNLQLLHRVCNAEKGTLVL